MHVKEQTSYERSECMYPLSFIIHLLVTQYLTLSPVPQPFLTNPSKLRIYLCKVPTVITETLIVLTRLSSICKHARYFQRPRKHLESVCVCVWGGGGGP